MKAMGAPADVIEAKRREWLALQPEWEPTEVFPENVQSFEVFLALADQWEFPGAYGGRLGVAKTEIEATLRLMGVRGGAAQNCFARLRTLIGAAREIFLQKHKAEQARQKVDRERIPTRHRH